MTDEQIIFDWLNRDVNTNKLLTIAYPKEVYDFIVSSCAGFDKFYKVGNVWQKIIIKNKLQ